MHAQTTAESEHATQTATEAQPAPAPARGRRPWWWAIVVLLALFAAAAIILTTRWGAGLSPDSVTYLRMADVFDRGGGVFTPVNGRALATSHYPPMYPFTISTLTIGSTRLKDTARWLNVVLVLINVLLVAALTWRATGHRWATVAATAIAACSLAFIEIHAWAWSEALFLTWAMAALLLLSVALSRPQATRWLVLAAMATAAAALTRYSGIALVAACTLSILMLRRDPWNRRLIDAFGFGLIASAPLWVWMARNAAIYGTTVNRKAKWMGFDGADVDQLCRTINAWVFPLQRGLDVRRAVQFTPTVVAWLLAAALIAVGYVWWRRRRRGADTGISADADPAAIALRRLLAIFGVCYFGLVAVTICLLDSSTPFDTRILSPVQVVLLVGAAVFASRVASAGRLGAIAVAAAVVLLIAVNVYASVIWGRTSHRRGLGYAMRQWHTSPALAHVGRLPRDTRIHSNVPELIEAHLHRHSFTLPRPYNVSTRSRTNYEQGLRNLSETLRETGGVVVWFKSVPRNSQLESERDLMKKLNVVRIIRSKDGHLYQHRDVVAAATMPATRPASRPAHVPAPPSPDEVVPD